MTQGSRLSRREREIMDILLECREASARDVRERLTDPPSDSAVRAMLARLENKGLVTHRERGLKYVYSPKTSREQAKASAIDRLARVFFDGSMAGAVTGMVERSRDELSDDELAELEALIRDARRRRRDP